MAETSQSIQIQKSKKTQGEQNYMTAQAFVSSSRYHRICFEEPDEAKD